MKKKNLCCLLLVVFLITVLSGCRIYTEYTVNEDGTIVQTSMTALSQEEVEGMEAGELSAYTVQTLEDGKEYYTLTETTDTTSQKLLQENTVLTKDIFYYSFANTAESMEQFGMTEDDLYMKMTVHLGGEIVDTNANVETESNTVAFDTKSKDTTWYAYTEAGKAAIEADTEAPKMKGATNKKWYKSLPSKIRFTDNVAVKSVTLNGKDVKASYVTEDDKIVQTMWDTADGSTAEKNGKNVFVVTDLNGNVSEFTIYLDTKKPVIKGVTNNKKYNKNKVTIYVKDNKKVAKVTINGKSQKVTKKQLVKKGKYKGYYKYTVKKKGTNKIVVRDAVGNKKTIKIKLKK